MPPAPPAPTLWTRLGRSISESAPAVRFNTSVLQHQWVLTARDLRRDLWARLREIFRPVALVLRGLRRAAKGSKGWWDSASKRKRQIHAGGAAGGAALLMVAPYGPVLLILGVLGWAAWLGRDTARKGADPESAEHIARLQAIYNGLVPYLHDEHDPDQHFKPGGGYRDAFTSWDFDEQDRLTAFTLDYSEYVRDGEIECRMKVERAVEGKVGRGNEFLYDWDEEGNHLAVRVLPPLPAGLAAQPWPVAEIEYVLGVTDPDSAGRLIPVLLPDEPDEAPESVPTEVASPTAPPPEGWRAAALAPVIWRVGAPCPHPHLLVTGPDGSGKTTVLRSLLGQALGRGQQVAVIDVEQSDAFADLSGRPGVRAVIDDPEHALALIEWFGLECERRAERRREAAEALADEDTGSFPALRLEEPETGRGTGPRAGRAAGRAAAAAAGPAMSPQTTQSAAQPGGGVPREPAAAEPRAGAAAWPAPGRSDPRRPDPRRRLHGHADMQPNPPRLWLCVDGLTELLEAAARLGRPDIEDALAVLARKARYADVLLLTTVREERLLQLRPALRAQLTVRIAMGSVQPDVSTALFGGTLELGGSRRLAPGRGYARVGNGPVIRLQTPYAPPGDVSPLRAVGTGATPAAQAAVPAPSAG